MSSSSLSAHPSQRFWMGWGIVLLGALLVLALALLPPFVPPFWRGAVQAAFAPVCHQLPGRVLLLGGVPIAVCHRCLGIYAAVAAAPLAFLVLPVRARAWVRRRPLPLLALLGAPAFLDWLAGLVGLVENTPASRIVTGALLGLGLGIMLTSAVVHAFTESRPDEQPQSA